MTETKPLRVLLVEDNPDDAELILRALRQSGFDPAWRRVESEGEYLPALGAGFEIVLSDYQLPAFSGMRALALLQEHQPDTPFILISGTIGEEIAVAAMREGATDYLLKDRLRRLGPAVRLALEQGRLRRERRALQNELALRQRQLDVFFTRAPAGLALLDRELRYVQINPTLAEFNGQPVESHLGRTPAEVIPSYAPLLEPLFRQVLDTTRPILNAELSCESANHPGGVRFWTESIFPVLGDDGQPEGLGVIVVDTTARRRAEARVGELAAMLDLAHDAIVVRGLRDRRVRYWNRGAERLYGWTAGEAIGRDIGELIFIDPAVPDVITGKLLRDGEWRGEQRHRSKAGQELAVSSHASLVGGPGDEKRAVLLINFDVTGQKNLEAQMLRAQRLESIGTLASGVAHDLNNILSPIMMSAPLLRRDLPEATRDDIVETIEKSAARGAQIVRQVLTFGRGVEGERQPLQLRTLIAELKQIVGETFPKSIRVEATAGADLWPVMGDVTQMHQVLLNLAVNARDAMPSGGALCIRAANLDSQAAEAVLPPECRSGPWVRIEVSDTGGGIPPEVIERIFEPFFTTKGLGEGTGLGLSTAFGIVRSHGGFIHATSTPGEGACFQVLLPAALHREAGNEEAAPAPPPPTTASEVVLVVDDEPRALAATESILVENGYQVLLAADGVHALSLFALHGPRISVVLTDVMMPNMDGIALARTLREMRPGLPVIAATGLGDEAQRSALHALGVEAILEKPFRAPAMLNAVHRALRK